VLGTQIALSIILQGKKICTLPPFKDGIEHHFVEHEAPSKFRQADQGLNICPLTIWIYLKTLSHDLVI